MKNNLPECEQFDGVLCDICNGNLITEGQESDADYAATWQYFVTEWRAQRGLAPIGQKQDEWNVSQKSRGLGDSIAKLTHATGINRVVHAVSKAVGVPCNCPGRQATLNAILPYTVPVSDSKSPTTDDPSLVQS